MNYKMFFLIFNVLYLNNNIIISSESYYICNCEYGRGLFSCMASVIGFLDFLENNHANGTVVFNEGVYLDKEYGINWWEYHFEPIVIGEMNSPNIIPVSSPSLAIYTATNMPPERFCELYHRYIKPKKHILDKVNEFVDKNFKDKFVIGVHYRGTDKQLTETNKITPQEVINLVLYQLSQLDLKEKSNLTIFIATDEQKFLDLAIKNIPNVVYQENAKRISGKEPLILGQQKHSYQDSAYTVIDCLLLSKSNLLIRTNSNLSMTSMFINPTMQTVSLNHSFGGARLK